MDNNPTNPNQVVDPFQPQAPMPQPHQPTPVPTPETTPPPSIEKPKGPRKLKWTYLLIFFLILIIIALLGILYMNQNQQTASKGSANVPSRMPTPTSAPTPEASSSAGISDWKTYSNSKYGVSINYPPSWIVDSNESIAANSGRIFSIYESTPGSVRVDFHKNFQGDFCNGQTLTSKETTINQREAEIYYCDGNPQAISYYVQDDEFWLVGVFVDEENASTFEEIFNSFKY